MVFNRIIGPPKAVITGIIAWVSILEYISIDRRALHLLVIYRGILPSTPFDAWLID